MAKVYSRYARSGRKRRAWEATNPGNQAIRAELLSHVLRLVGPELAGPSRIIDIGCGTGWWLDALAHRGIVVARLHGVDISPERVDAARARVPGALLTVADARALPHPDGSFGLALLFTTLSSLVDHAAVAAALGEVRRVLEPGGVALVYEPRLPTPLNRATRRITAAELQPSLGKAVGSLTLTVLPPLARRLGPATRWAYPRLSRVSVLRSHRLIVYRPVRPGQPRLNA